MKTSARIAIALAALVETALVSSPAGATTRPMPTTTGGDGPPEYSGGCAYCTKEPRLLTNATDLHVAMKWCGISQAPAVANPAILGCTTVANFKDMMWRRHERASDCIWIPQCKLTLRSGGAVQSSDYKQLADLDTSIGLPGDVVIEPITEMDNTWAACDAAWSAQPKGIVSVSVNRLINSSGMPVARGIAYLGSITQPWMAVADPTVYRQLNERSLAHEAGHVLGLGHVLTNGNLMQTGGSGATIDMAQCTAARAYVSANPILDPPVQAASAIDVVDFLDDARGDFPSAPFRDLTRGVVTDAFATGGALSLCAGTTGKIPRGGGADFPDLSFWFLLDVDNNTATGKIPSDLIGGVPGLIAGVDLVAQVRLAPGGQITPLLHHVGEFGVFVPLLLPPGTLLANVRDIALVICDPEPGYSGPSSIPGVFSEVDFKISASGLSLLGFPLGQNLFPNDLHFQVTTSVPGGGPTDLGPNTGGVMELPVVVFPTLTSPAQASPGQTITIGVVDMPPQKMLKAILGEFMLPTSAVTNTSGQATFQVLVPPAMPLGQSMLTIGIFDPLQPANAITADASIAIVGGAPSGVNGANRHYLNNGGEVLFLYGDPSIGTSAGSGSVDTSGDLWWAVYPRQSMISCTGAAELSGARFFLADTDWSDGAPFFDMLFGPGTANPLVPGNIVPDFSAAGLSSSRLVSLGASGLPNPCTASPGFCTSIGGTSVCPPAGSVVGWLVHVQFSDCDGTGIVLTANNTVDNVVTAFVPGGMTFASGSPGQCGLGNYTLQTEASDDELQADTSPTVGTSRYGGFQLGAAPGFNADGVTERSIYDIEYCDSQVNTTLDGDHGTLGLHADLSVSSHALRMVVHDSAGVGPTNLCFVTGCVLPPFPSPGIPVFGACVLLNLTDALTAVLLRKGPIVLVPDFPGAVNPFEQGVFTPAVPISVLTSALLTLSQQAITLNIVSLTARASLLTQTRINQ